MTQPTPTRDALGSQYLDQLPYPPYPVQEEALLAWFMSDKGIMVCAPTGTGKTLIAEAAIFEALHAGSTVYYTTPLIALTEQKFRETQALAQRWGFPPESVGLVTGNRRVNPQARVLVVVAEILLNRLLNPEAFDFTGVSAVVMDEFHSFADPERGIVWELSLMYLPQHIRLMLLSATVGNAGEFLAWLDRCHGRKLDLVEGRERKVPLTYVWVPDQLLNEQLVEMAKGDAEARRTPGLVFCFNRDECWSVAEQLKGLVLLGPDQKPPLHAAIDALNWTEGVGPKMRQMLHRGVGVHHAGMLPKYRRVVEDLFQKKLLGVVICTETLASGINLPARSVVLSSLVKGPYGKQRLIDPSTAQQIFGRAGRPQYDTRGYVYSLAHEDDVKILRWKEKYDQIPETTRDPGLIKAKKALKKKKPSRRDNATYWSEAQFNQLQAAPPGKLYSKGPLPWRLLAYLLEASPEVARLRAVLKKRLMDEPRVRASEKALMVALRALADGGYVTLDPTPPIEAPDAPPPPPDSAPYVPALAKPEPKMKTLLLFRGIHPLYGAYLIEQLALADNNELIQSLESVLELPRPILRSVRVPRDLPPGPLATTRMDEELIRRGLMLAPVEKPDEEEDFEEERGFEERPTTLADKLFLLFQARYPLVDDISVQSVWCAGEVLVFGGNFNKYVQSRDLVKQEGIVFRHLLRLILLCEEFAQATPPDLDPQTWRERLRDIAERLTESCRAVDPSSTEEIIQQAQAAEVLEGVTPLVHLPGPKS
jgi:superfamily II DNA/RNA helicase